MSIYFTGSTETCDFWNIWHCSMLSANLRNESRSLVEIIFQLLNNPSGIMIYRNIKIYCFRCGILFSWRLLCRLGSLVCLSSCSSTFALTYAKNTMLTEEPSLTCNGSRLIQKKLQTLYRKLLDSLSWVGFEMWELLMF